MKNLEKEFDKRFGKRFRVDLGNDLEKLVDSWEICDFIKDKVKEVVDSVPISESDEIMYYAFEKDLGKTTSFGKIVEWRDNILKNL